MSEQRKLASGLQETAMRIEDFDSECDVTKPADVEAALSKRHDGGINSFWLSHEAEEFPAINIMVKGELAYVFSSRETCRFCVGRRGAWSETKRNKRVAFVSY
jgi:hypothetical protein